MIYRSRVALSVLPVLLVVFVACGGDAPVEEPAGSDQEAVVAMIDGPCRPAYGADLCTWAETTGDRITSFGVNVPMTSVEGAPADAEMVWPPPMTALIPLPDAVQDQLGVHNITFYWEAHGHPPGPYLVPHFDFHFYTIDREQVDAIDCSNLTKPSAPPTGYVLADVDIPDIGFLTGLCVPAMGMHALLAEELEGDEVFDGTMVIGYYAEEPIFFEPMVTRELLMARQPFSLDMPVVPGATIPTSFEARFDEATDSYQFAFSGMPEL